MARPPRDMLWAGAGIAAFVALLGLTTNHLDTVRFHWDFEHYRRMAQEGLGAPGLVAPFAYRFGYTEPVRLAHGALGWSIDTGFAVVACLGAAAAVGPPPETKRAPLAGSPVRVTRDHPPTARAATRVEVGSEGTGPARSRSAQEHHPRRAHLAATR